MPSEFAPRAARFRRKPSAATSSASSHVAFRREPFSRTSGCVRRAYDPGADLVLGMCHLRVMPEDTRHFKESLGKRTPGGGLVLCALDYQRWVAARVAAPLAPLPQCSG